ncbi:uncharacterized protein LOC129786987 [Lutzomyia longipalpis]|uniref:uncharacterized protein LOC129786987 n=1 Tax=Lutzomyia longipalpis TaxID=7200 RepID=UPI0024837FFC|nr:uncharacterized protein LOC129786987 [Lutzomyia longipalpis]
MNSFFRKCLAEVAQEENGHYGLVLEILTSRRLLVDHQEILEDVFQSSKCKATSSQWFTFRKSMGIFVGSLGFTEFLKSFQIYSKFILIPPLFASGYCLMASVKEYRDLRNHGKISKIHRLIEDLNAFDAFLRRQMMFLKEMSLFRAKIKSSSEWEAILTQKTIKSVRRITKLLYQETQDLEERFEVPSKYQGIYQPLDKLEDCEYFRKAEEEFDEKHIKEFFNIFLYIQSQFLLKIPLTAVSEVNGFSQCGKKVAKIREAIGRELKENSENLDYFLQPTSAETTRLSIDPEESKGKMRQFLCLKSASGAIVTKFLSLATQLRIFDRNLQAIEAGSEDNLLKELRRMKETLEVLSTSFTCINLEFENLHLIHSKILNLPCNALLDPTVLATNNEDKAGKVEDLSANPTTDEFFHLDTSADGNWEQEAGGDFDLADYEYDRVNQKLIKSSFKPVLVQLRKRIHPLHDAMKERERKFLKSRGVDVPGDSDGDFSDSLEEESDVDSLGYDEDSPQRKPRTSKYDENREFLEEKQRTGLFFSLPPPQNLLSEDVLE